MVWQEYSKRLREVLGLEGSPIAVSYSMDPASKGKSGKHWVCQALLDARDGAIINLSKESSACPGGAWHLGLTPRPSGRADKALKRFLVEGEKLFCSIATFHRAMSLTTPPPLGLAEYVVFSPLEKAEIAPDLVVFLCNPEQACRLVTLATYPDGLPPKTEIVGSTCHMVIAYPVVSGELNISLLDYTSRKYQDYKPEELFVSIPYHKLPGLVGSIDLCSAGTAQVEFPTGFGGPMRRRERQV
ncbi:MAG: DUF169 domain-containing protein [Dehalococcoidia bacterium]|nr:DUF169 domain-containing protein [Dehalococcoidia bacterium]